LEKLMKVLKNLVLASLLLIPLSIAAQVSNPSVIPTSPPGSCTAGVPLWAVFSTGTLYICNNGTPTAIGGGSGTFNALTGDAISTATGGATTVKGLNGTLLSGLGTGILKNTTGTGVPSIAVAADFPTLNQNTTGTSGGLSGSPAITVSSCTGCGGGSYPTPETHTASNSAELDFTSCISSSYMRYVIRETGMQVGTTGAVLLLQFSTNGGSSYDSGTNYSWFAPDLLLSSGAVGGNGQSSGAIAIPVSIASSLTSGQAASADPPGMLTFELSDPLNTATNKQVEGYAGQGVYNAGGNYAFTVHGVYANHSAVNAFRIIPSTGSIASGTATCQPQPQ
jgi:hypothetical protein